MSVAKTKTARKQLEKLIEELESLKGTEAFNGRELWMLKERLANEDYIRMEPALAKGDLEFMALQDHPDERVALLCTARAENNTSIAMSRCLRFLEVAQRGTLPVLLAD